MGGQEIPRKLKRRRNKTQRRLKGDAKKIQRRFTGDTQEAQRRFKGEPKEAHTRIKGGSREIQQRLKRKVKEAQRKLPGSSKEAQERLKGDRKKNERNSNEAQRRPKKAHRNYKEINKAQTDRTLNKKVGRGKQLTKDPLGKCQIGKLNFERWFPKVSQATANLFMLSTMA